MSIREFLRNQELGFISLHEVLSRLRDLHGDSYADVAQFLIRTLRQSADKGEPLVWYEVTKIQPMTALSDEMAATAWRCLEQACQEGEPPVRPRWNDNDVYVQLDFDTHYPNTLHRQYFDEIGFDRNSLIQFLLTRGLDITAGSTSEKSIVEPVPLPEGTVSRQLLAYKEQIAGLQQRIQLLEAKVRDFEELKKELSRLQRKLTKIIPMVAYGKVRRTFLTIIGALVSTHYKIDIYSDRKDGIGEIIDDLERAQCPLNDKTVRECLKDAAEVLKIKTAKSQ